MRERETSCKVLTSVCSIMSNTNQWRVQDFEGGGGGTTCDDSPYWRLFWWPFFLFFAFVHFNSWRPTHVGILVLSEFSRTFFFFFFVFAFFPKQKKSRVPLPDDTHFSAPTGDGVWWRFECSVCLVCLFKLFLFLVRTRKSPDWVISPDWLWRWGTCAGPHFKHATGL